LSRATFKFLQITYQNLDFALTSSLPQSFIL